MYGNRAGADLEFKANPSWHTFVVFNAAPHGCTLDKVENYIVGNGVNVSGFYYPFKAC